MFKRPVSSKTGRGVILALAMLWSVSVLPASAVTVKGVANPTSGGTVSVSPNNGSNLVAGATATLTATANNSWVLLKWNDGNTNATRTITVPASNINYTGTFVQVKINTRQLTSNETKSCPSGTRIAAGLANAGVGQPLYLEALVTKSTVVSSVTWTLINKPSASTLTNLQDSPVTNSLPTYDGGDRLAYDVASRKMLVPDVASESLDVATDTWNDYIVRTLVTLSNGVSYAVTNTYTAANYMGVNTCALCHDDKMPGFNATPHATAFKEYINGADGAAFTESRCISCHVLGYDKTAGATNDGFDDIAKQNSWTFPTNLANLALATNNWAAMPLALQNKANVQCENCHGPGGRHVTTVFATAVTPDISKSIGISLSAGNCGQCHDAPTHHVKNLEWSQTAHAIGADAFKGPLGSEASCAPCHSGQGFIKTYDPDYAATNAMPRGTGNEGITCATCHEPHSPGMGAQLRAFASVTLSNGVVNTLGGSGLVCMQCHKARKDGPAYVDSMGSVTRWGPHHGPQGDMLIGTNAIEYGMAMPRSRHINVLEDSCVECHMQPTPTNGVNAVAMNKVGAHTFSLKWTDPTNTTNVDLTTTCVKCHGEIENFNFGGEDYDRDGVVEGVQAEIQGLMNTVAMLLPPYGSTNMPVPAANWTLSQRRAAYNYMFVWEDRSLGVHNPKYAAAILQASVDDLRGGIDVNRDGLPDSWQAQYYGSMTNTNAAPGADPIGKGLSNLQNYQLGLDPTKLDTDGDGYTDVVELQAGSNPLLAGSTPATNQLSILPAVELAYLGATNGVPMHFQMIDTLSGGTWTNIEPGFTSTNAWIYKLISPRGTKQQFFRVSTP